LFAENRVWTGGESMANQQHMFNIRCCIRKKKKEKEKKIEKKENSHTHTQKKKKKIRFFFKPFAVTLVNKWLRLW
jgi:hypothetical protein